MEGALSLLALVTVVVSAGVITVAAHFRKERATELQAWAREHGWHYTEHHPSPLEDAVLPRAVQGPDTRARHVLTGRRGTHLTTMFEVTRSTSPVSRRGSGQERQTYRVVAVRTPGPGADLEIHRRDLARIVSLDGRGDPEEVGRAFSEAFRTVGTDDDFTRAVLGQDTVSWLLSDCRSRSLPVRFTGSHVLTWAAMHLDPDRALTAADYLIDLVDRIPAQAWERDTTEC
ncbi:hypothetical protein GCM10007079_38440 [Nocardiopsis terrae]|uniref:Uncharacterized protein n=1 Tax=Nocardiopsis terrae TaxID=372655 RepID=A0ABR9HEL1_9ACTN|nr:hypothetical protein [Nocardiopsis terrae]MBE1457230.1 hypothetical protein [Nocardiopsis terrae]GHC91272.1 hypothetical protein GCM10007079_38440 [Nocardiopsis terrae]